MITRRLLTEAASSTNASRLIEIAENKAVLIWRRLASNPSLPARVLDKIWHPFDPIVWRLIAKNPSTPARWLPTLAAEFPDEVLANPSLPLALLEDPGLLERTSLLCYLLKAKNVSEEMLASASESAVQTHRWLAAKHPKTPTHWIARLAFDHDIEVRRAAIQNKKIPEVLDKIRHYQQDELSDEEWRRASQDEYLRLLMAQNPTLSEARVEHLFAEGPKQVQYAVLRRPAIPSSIVEMPTNELAPYAVALLARHPQTPRAVLERLLKEPLPSGNAGSRRAEQVLAALSESPRLTPPMIQSLINAGYISAQLASLPSLTEAQLKTILSSSYAGDPQGQSIRITAANHPNAPKHVLSLFSRAGFDAKTGTYEENNVSLSSADEDELIKLGIFGRGLVVRNPGVTASRLVSLLLADKESFYLSKFAEQNRGLDVNAVLAASDAPSIRVLLMNHPNATEALIYQLWKESDNDRMLNLQPSSADEIFVQLSRSYVSTSRIIAARNVHLPAQLREILSRDYVRDVRATIAERSDLSRAQLTRLLQDTSPEVRKAAAKNPGAPQRFLSVLRRCGASSDLTSFDTPDESLPIHELKRLARGSYFSQLVAVRHPKISSDSLHRLIDALIEIASYAVCHPNIREESLLKVAQRKHRALHLAMLRRTYPLSEEVLFALLGSDSQQVRRLTSQRREASALRDLFYRVGASGALDGFVEPDGEVTPEIMQRFARGGLYAQQLAARHPKTNQEKLLGFLSCMKPSLRSLAAQNPNTPQEAIALLRKVGASHDLTEIESPDDDVTEANFEAAQQLGPFGELLVRLMRSV